MRKISDLSLAARVSLVVAAFLAVAGGITGLIVYQKVKTSLQNELESRCLARITALQSNMELDAGRFELEDKLPQSGADSWKITAADGTLLWSRNWKDGDADTLIETRPAVIGLGEGPLLNGSALKKRSEPSESGNTSYAVQDGARGIAVNIAVRMPSERMTAELRRLALALWTVGPIAILLVAGIVALFVRWQLGPLAEIAREASQIGPENMVARIGPVGNSIECVRLREAINRMVGRLADGLERERKFSAIAAHELRTPLAQLRINIEVALRKDRLAGDYREALAGCLLDVERLQNLVANLLVITRSENATYANQSAQLDRVIAQAQDGCGSKPAVLTAPEKGVIVQGNEELLISAVRNVLENAQRYAPGEPPRISVSNEKQEVTVSIADSGPGIPEKDRERVFDLLVRLDQARTVGEKAEGFGLGLTVARAAARACGGELLCAARADGQPGAEFKFVFKKS